MDDTNISEKDRQIDAESNGLQNFTDACSTMKDEISQEADRLLSSQDLTSTQTFTDACSAMKDSMATEAQRIIFDDSSASHQPAVESQTDAIASTEVANSSSSGEPSDPESPDSGDRVS
jgi:hypothetical protein